MFPYSKHAAARSFPGPSQQLSLFGANEAYRVPMKRAGVLESPILANPMIPPRLHDLHDNRVRNLALGLFKVDEVLTFGNRPVAVKQCPTLLFRQAFERFSVLWPDVGIVL